MSKNLVTFATSCYERDWKGILLDPLYLAKKQIANHKFSFCERLLIINNVLNLDEVMLAAQEKIKEGVLTRVVIAKDREDEIFRFFGLIRDEFSLWNYYNALAPLCAIYTANTDYLLYQTGDVFLNAPVSWIPKALRMMQKEGRYKVANLLWNHKAQEASSEAMFRSKGFYVSSRGFSDQMFLVKVSDFRAPIYHEIREDSHHYPYGDIFEKRVYSAMRNRGFYRLTYAKGSYIHENFP